MNVQQARQALVEYDVIEAEKGPRARKFIVIH
jgi:hypothetical protein